MLIQLSIENLGNALDGVGAIVYAYGSEIGRVLGLKIIALGAEYQQSPSPTIGLPGYLIIMKMVLYQKIQ
jgi:hypothetical protein